jgi:hypothetical protein
MVTKNTSRDKPVFTCENCDFKCSKKGDWNRHINTSKHARLCNEPKKDIILHNFGHKCEKCLKLYKSRNGLWSHKKKCNIITSVHPALFNKIDMSSDPNSLTLLVIDLMKSNQELQKQMLEVCKNSNSNNNNNNNNNNNHSHNKTFNMQFFLNEQCKDAMNIMDFVDTFKLEFSDLERVGEVGYVEGMSNIIIQKLNEMDIYKRPIHCSDEKRETMFVKDKNVWEKETGNHDRLRLAIRYITKKNTDMILPWCYSHPGSCDSDNYLNDVYLQIVQHAMGEGNIEENENKIMRKIARSCLIDKNGCIT